MSHQIKIKKTQHTITNRSLDNSSLIIVNSKHDTVCWVQPIDPASLS